MLLQEPVTKPRRTPTATAVHRALKLPVARPLRPKPGQLPRFALVVLLPAPAISVRQKAATIIRLMNIVPLAVIMHQEETVVFATGSDTMPAVRHIHAHLRKNVKVVNV